MKCSLKFSSFLEEISSSTHSVVFLYFFALFIKEAFLISIAILWNSAFSCVYLSLSSLLLTSLHSSVQFSSVQSLGRVRLFVTPWIAAGQTFTHQLFVKTPQTTTVFLHFYFWQDGFGHSSCKMLCTSVHRSSGTMSIRFKSLNLFVISTV